MEEPHVLDLDQLGLVHNEENKIHKYKIFSIDQCSPISSLVTVSH